MPSGPGARSRGTRPAKKEKCHAYRAKLSWVLDRVRTWLRSFREAPPVGQGESPPGAEGTWVILRQKLRIEHVDPVHRTLEVELTVRNDTGEPSRDLPLELDKYRPGLSMHMSDGVELGYLPTREVFERFNPPGDPDPDPSRAHRTLWV